MRLFQLIAILVVIVVLVVLGPMNASATRPSFTTLQPGQTREINQNLQINMVFVEVGHHLGETHPHDGFDFEDFSYWSPNGSDTDSLQHYYMWTGEGSDSVMSYMNFSNNFSQLDRDNMNRRMTAIYINQANAILPRILASPRVGDVNGLLSSADADASAALPKYDSMDYLGAVLKAKSAYDKVLAGAAQISITIEPNGAPSELRNHRPNPGLIDPPLGRTHLLSPVPETSGMQQFR